MQRKQKEERCQQVSPRADPQDSPCARREQEGEAESCPQGGSVRLPKASSQQIQQRCVGDVEQQIDGCEWVSAASTPKHPVQAEGKLGDGSVKRRPGYPTERPPGGVECRGSQVGEIVMNETAPHDGKKYRGGERGQKEKMPSCLPINHA